MTSPDPRDGSEASRRYAPDFLTELFQNPLDPGYADAAAAPPRPAWRRRGALLLRTIALILTGFLLAVAYRHATASDSDDGARAALVDEVRTAQDRTDDLQRRADTLQQDVGKLRDEALGGTGTDLERLREQEAATGGARVRGDGIVVSLADAPPRLDPQTGEPAAAEGGRVLDVDLQDVANGLWSVGAEAIAINGQRLTSTSTIRAAGQAILVDFRPVTSPYEVSAIGPDDLEERFLASRAAAVMRGLVKEYGLSFGTRAERNLTLPAASGGAPLEYAHPPSPSLSPSPSVSPSPSTSPSPTGGN